MKDKKKERERKSHAKVLRRRAAIRRQSSKERKEQKMAFKSRNRETPIRIEVNTPPTTQIDPVILRNNADELIKMLDQFDETENTRKARQEERLEETNAEPEFS